MSRLTIYYPTSAVTRVQRESFGAGFRAGFQGKPNGKDLRCGDAVQSYESGYEKGQQCWKKQHKSE